jgi:cytochrome c-type biogenesis protein CcmH/NrfF
MVRSAVFFMPSTTQRARLIWLLPVLVVLLSVAVVGWTSLERRRVGEDLDHLIEEHVEYQRSPPWLVRGDRR